MNTFKRKSLYAALAGLGALGATGAAQAVNVNPDGLGQALIYPYYTTRADSAGNTFTSLLSVVNSTSSAKAVKVRFLEGKNSREVLDFNLFLSPYDVWTAAVLPSLSGAGARVATADKSCTLPPIPPGGQDFVNFAYSGGTVPNDDRGGASLDRTREGYVEIIDMGWFEPGSTTAIQVTHVNGVPPGCGSVSDAQAAADIAASNDFGPFLSGGLFGGMTLINVASGTDYTEDAVALDQILPFRAQYFPSGSIQPQFSDAFPQSTVFGVNGSVYQTNWGAGNGADAVSAVLMHDNVMNEFVLDAGTRSGTDWVVTMPTKRFYVQVSTNANANPLKLFQRNFNTTVGACDDVSLDLYDREEFQRPGGFSPAPPGSVNQLCWEANVITFNNPNPAVGAPTVVLGSTNSTNVTTTFQNGWMRLGFLPGSVTGVVHKLFAPNAQTTITPVNGSASTGQNATYFGLPVVGFAVQSFANGVTQAGVLSNYGGNFVHKTTRRIQ